MESCRTRNLLFIDSVASWYRKPVSTIESVSLSTLTLLPLMFERVARGVRRDAGLRRVAAGYRRRERVLERNVLRDVARSLGVGEVLRGDALARGQSVK